MKAVSTHVEGIRFARIFAILALMPYLCGVWLAASLCAEFGEVRLGELALVFYFFS